MITLFHPTHSDRADDFWVAPDGSVRHRWYMDGKWSAEENLQGQVTSVSAAWRHDAKQLRLVVAGNDGPYERVHDVATGTWRPWIRLPGELAKA